MDLLRLYCFIIVIKPIVTHFTETERLDWRPNLLENSFNQENIFCVIDVLVWPWRMDADAKQ